MRTTSNTITFDAEWYSLPYTDRLPHNVRTQLEADRELFKKETRGLLASQLIASIKAEAKALLAAYHEQNGDDDNDDDRELESFRTFTRG